MDENITVGLVVATVILASAGAVLLMDDGIMTGFAVLDSADNLEEGQIFYSHTIMGPQTIDTTYRITQVSDGQIECSMIMYSYVSEYSPTVQGLDYYAPNAGEFQFDYTDPSEIPEGLTVTQVGEVYTFSGTLNGTTYDSLAVAYDGTNVTSVSGVIDISSDFGDYHAEGTIEYTTEAGVLKAKGTTHSSDIQTQTGNDFLDMVAGVFNPAQYPGATVTQEPGTLDGYAVTIYTVNGTVGTQTAEDLKLYTYGDRVVKMDGKINGETIYDELTITA